MIMKNLLYILLSVITLALAGCSTTDNKKETDTTVVVENADEKETELSTDESEEVEATEPTENETNQTETAEPTEEQQPQTEETASTQEETVKEVPTEAPTEVPTEVPTQAPTEAPTEVPTEAPTEEPPTEEPPTEAPTQPTVQEPEFVAYNPYNVAQMANDKVKAAGKILLPENLDRLLAEGAITQEEYNEYYPYDGCGYYPNLSDINEINNVTKEIYEKYGKIDILINNAGVSASKKIEDTTSEEFKQIMDINVNAMFNMTSSVLPYMKENHYGVILNTSSMVSIYGQPSGVGYPTSKFAVNGFTKSLARELGKYNIRVNAVAPGITNTDMVSSLPKEVIEPLIKTIPLGRIGEPKDIANAFLFLASPMADYVTGTILSVDGAARS